jgi:hypothetical protein
MGLSRTGGDSSAGGGDALIASTCASYGKRKVATATLPNTSTFSPSIRAVNDLSAANASCSPLRPVTDPLHDSLLRFETALDHWG